LALTSNDLVVRILSYPLWKLIHRLAYVAAIALFIHRGFGTHDDMLGSTLALFAPLLLLEILRVLRQMYNFLAGLVHHMRAEHPAFEGVRKFRVTRKEAECDDITSFYLEPVDGRKLKPFKPGQFLTYELEIPGHPEPVVRCYSLSDAPHPKHYRASIKRVPAPKDKPEVPPGLGSNFFHDHVNVGDLLNVRAPSGSFHLNPRGKNPVVLIGSGIGLTPVLSMLKAMADLGSKREVWFFYGVRNKGEAAMQKEMEAAIARLPNGQLRICHSQPHKESVQGTDYHFNQRVTMDLLKEALPHNRYDFYFCGPGPMMQNLAEGFEAWGIPPARIHFEEFGPSTVKRRDATPGAAASATIFFKRSGKKLLWDGRQNSLLQFAESHGLKLRFGCRGGGCGTCKVRLLKGEILYPTPPGADPGPQYVLTCQGLPKGDLELDA
ncbi:MAG: 2Fe-2S iron-sulfur cluster-binding protein, partial [Verrucomicrobiae bacterium]|nr:2Fe-2S iron-sulfur cluster-binding protein [Verrucomicrobiae bacterium]